MKLAISKDGKYPNEAAIKALLSNGILEQAIVLNEDDGKVYMYFEKATLGDIRPNDNPEKGWWILDTSLVFSNIVKIVPNDHDFVTENDEDYSSLEKWDEVILQGTVDYKMARKEIKNLFFAEAGMSLENWETISQKHKEIASKYFLVPKSYRDQIFSTQEQCELGEKFHRRAVICRENRVVRVLTILRCKLTVNDANDVIDDLNEIYDKVDGRKFSRNLLRTYIDLGREGTTSGDHTGIYDYIEGTGGFIDNGLADKGFIPVENTITEIIDEVMSVFRNGIL